MTRRSSDPRIVESTVRSDGLEIARQASPGGSAAFAATFIAPAGWAYEPPGSEGVAGLAAQVSASAAGDRDRVALARFLDQHGASLSRRVDPESSEATISGPETSFAPLLSVLADVALRPRFDRSDVERVRRQVLERQLREATQPGSRAERELLKAIFPSGHPYRDTGLGSRRSMGRLSISDLARFHARQTAPQGSYLIVTSRRPMAEVLAAARRLFRDFPGRSAPAPVRVPAPRSGSARSVDVPMPGRSQVEVMLGGPSIRRSDAVYDAAFLANEVLGGGMLSRLFQRVRESEGLAYHASSDVEALRWGGYWTAQAGTGPERTRSAVRAVREEIDRLRDRPIPITELDRIRRNVIGEIPLAFETAGGAHGIAQEVAYDHLGADFLVNWPRQLRALTPRDLRRAVGTAMGRAGEVTVLAGPLVSPTGRAG